uniref:Uncharacterized protein n=1 Tax=Acrobeloides nanus TaxID=290746 RepID=A0A914DH40_9BILA
MGDRKSAYQVNLLVEAEKRAKQKIDYAEARRKQLLNRAHKEASEEIAQHQKECSTKLDSKRDAIKADLKEDQCDINKAVKNALSTMNKNVEKRRNKVIKMLMDAVIEMKPQMPENWIIRHAIDEKIRETVEARKKYTFEVEIDDLSTVSEPTFDVEYDVSSITLLEGEITFEDNFNHLKSLGYAEEDVREELLRCGNNLDAAYYNLREKYARD